MVIASIPLAVFGGFAMMAVWLATHESLGAAVAVGCLGGTAAVFLTLASCLWLQLAMAAAAAGPLDLWRAVGRGLSVLARRIGAMLVLVLLAIVVGITMAIVFVPFSLVIEVVVRDSFWGYIVAQVVMTFCQSLFSAVLSVAFAAALVALVRGEISTRELQVA
jgi:hypothetical protein